MIPGTGRCELCIFKRKDCVEHVSRQGQRPKKSEGSSKCDSGDERNEHDNEKVVFAVQTFDDTISDVSFETVNKSEAKSTIVKR
jgi:hypothetical protein